MEGTFVLDRLLCSFCIRNHKAVTNSDITYTTKAHVVNIHRAGGVKFAVCNT